MVYTVKTDVVLHAPIVGLDLTKLKTDMDSVSYHTVTRHLFNGSSYCVLLSCIRDRATGDQVPIIKQLLGWIC